jgi:hypothetical protein
MNRFFIAHTNTIAITKTLKSKGFIELDEQIINLEADEMFSLWIDKENKSFHVTDHQSLLEKQKALKEIFKDEKTININLKEIEKW